VPVFFDRAVALIEHRRRTAAAQRALDALSHLDAHTLRDIGLTRHGSREAGLDAVNDNPDRARDCA
jgi:uncharacterized protein YjiS (DUF1127 family)